jgi:hypothetical protein
MKFLKVAAAAAALGAAGVAHAQYPGQYGYGQYGGYSGVSDWNYGSRYSLFDREYRHTIEGIRHGLSDGSFTRWQADRFYRELESIRYDAMRSMRYGNYNDDYIQARMERLHQRMHFRHERNHERYDGYGSYGGYGDYQPGYGSYYNGGDDHHDD